MFKNENSYNSIFKNAKNSILNTNKVQCIGTVFYNNLATKLKILTALCAFTFGIIKRQWSQN